MPRPVVAQIAAALAALVAIAAVTALWIVNLRMGPRLEAFSGGPMVIFVPLALILLVLLWILIRGFFSSVVRWGALTTILGAGGLALLVVVLYCAPAACFMPDPGRLLGWFVVLGAAFAALVHHIVLARFSGGSHAADT